MEAQDQLALLEDLQQLEWQSRRAKLTSAAPLTVVAFIMAFLSFPTRAIGQNPDDSIAMGSIQLRLGMGKDLVIGRLTQEFKVNPIAGTDSEWGISSKIGPPYEPIGSIAFSNGKLSYIAKAWGDARDAVLGGAIYGAIANFVDEGRTTCTIDTKHTDTPGLELKDAFISCGKKRLTIQVMRSKTYGDSVGISEVLSEH